jgi:hypothetical protein
MDLERDLVPTPQVLEQAPQAPQPESLQSMGQAKVLQLLKPMLLPQGLPPKRAGVTMDLVRRWVPVAQVAEQAPQADQRDS